jgi:hypothetical protein
MRLLPAMFAFRRNVVIGRTLVAPEPADLGTAFGLDACLDEEPDMPLPEHNTHEPPPTESPTAWLARRR